MTGKIALDRKPIELGQAVRHCLATLRAASPEDHHQVTIGGEPVWVSADATRLDQVITNLLTNAFKYTPADGRVEIETGTDGADAVLTVRDHGVGISPRLLPQIFEVFVQGDASIDRARGGLGIGLALVRQLVVLHGGSVIAASDGPGRGSAFTVRIPLAPAPADERPAQPAASRPVERRRVLLVDDHDDSRNMLSLMLRFSGYEPLEARDGPEGLRMALQEKPDIAVIDIGLPGTDGYEVARRLRAEPATRALPLIALTGYGQNEDRRRALEAGFDLHLVKPVEAAQLLEAIATAGVERRGNEDEGRSSA
jgi:CheY-like chemotaxis protein